MMTFITNSINFEWSYFSPGQRSPAGVCGFAMVLETLGFGTAVPNAVPNPSVSKTIAKPQTPAGDLCPGEKDDHSNPMLLVSFHEYLGLDWRVLYS